MIAITHAHGDHVGDTVELAKQHGATVVAPVELADWLQIRHRAEELSRPEQGRHRRRRRHEVHAHERAPLELERTTSSTWASHAGSSSRRGRQEGLLRRRHLRVRRHAAHRPHLPPDVAVLPIGDHYTMGPKEAPLAVELLGVKRVVPCHWGTFPLLTGTPEALEQLAPSGVTVEQVAARRHGDDVRTRENAGSGRRDVACRSSRSRASSSVGDALVLDDVERRPADPEGVRSGHACRRACPTTEADQGRACAARGGVRAVPAGPARPARARSRPS